MSPIHQGPGVAPRTYCQSQNLNLSEFQFLSPYSHFASLLSVWNESFSGFTLDDGKIIDSYQGTPHVKGPGTASFQGLLVYQVYLVGNNPLKFGTSPLLLISPVNTFMS